MGELETKNARRGVVRVSAVHYNTVDEIDRAIAALDPPSIMPAAPS